jgi:hypothetical protein
LGAWGAELPISTEKRGAQRSAAIALCALASACGATSSVKHVQPVKRPPLDAGVVVDAGAEAGASKLELLAMKHAALAPGLREVLRSEIDLAHTQELALAPFDTDTCVRVALDADAPTAVVLQDAHAMTIGSIDAPSGAIGAAGPVCFRKGDVATLRFTGQSHVRVVVWQSP